LGFSELRIKAPHLSRCPGLCLGALAESCLEASST
jgi:hypothetical protein